MTINEAESTAFNLTEHFYIFKSGFNTRSTECRTTLLVNVKMDNICVLKRFLVVADLLLILFDRTGTITLDLNRRRIDAEIATDRFRI